MCSGRTFAGGTGNSACLNMSLSEKIPSVEETGGCVSHPSDSALACARQLPEP